MTDLSGSTGGPRDSEPGTVDGHGGDHAVAVAAGHGVRTMLTLSGAHVFPMYDGALKGDPPMRLLDVRQEQTAVFAAEATGKLTRVPGLAVLTAGPGVTNGVSPIAQAQFSGSPLVMGGGRAPTARWGQGSLQEIDHPPLLAPVTKLSRTVHDVADIATSVEEAFVVSGSSHRGPTFLDVPMDQFFSRTSVGRPTPHARKRLEPDPESLSKIGTLLAGARQPVLVIGTDVWADRAEEAALRFVESAGIPAVTNGMGRGIVPGGHRLLVTKARGTALGSCDLAIVIGTPLDFRLGYGVFGGKEGAPPAQVVHLADSASQVSGHVGLAGSAYGDVSEVIDGLQTALERQPSKPDWSSWTAQLQAGWRPPSNAAVSCWVRPPTPSIPPGPTGSSRPASRTTRS